MVDFGEIGAAFDAAHKVAVRQIKNAEVRFFRQRQVVDMASGSSTFHALNWV